MIKKLLVIVTLTLMLSSCGVWDRLTSKVTGGGTETCHKGVVYLQFTSGATVAYNTDGSIMLCS